MIGTQVVVSRFHQGDEIEQVVLQSTEEARSFLNDENKRAAKGWYWGLAKCNFFEDDGSPVPISETNALRRACGVKEY